MPQHPIYTSMTVKPIFTKAGDNIIPLYLLGMVTAASFTDIDNDGWKDLIVSGEWMPVKVFKNNKGKFSPVDIPASTGLWQSIYTTDVNGDGFADILAVIGDAITNSGVEKRSIKTLCKRL
jgi:hypothetical protein